jgi:hypothetical protein
MMTTLKRQYKIYQKQNPDSNLSYEEWEKIFLENLKLGMELGDDFSDWDVTLMDGLEDE